MPPIISNFVQSVDKTILLYFFSALAQCAAGFAALVGVFAVFRLQANSAHISEEYALAKHWLKVQNSMHGADSFTSQMVKSELENLNIVPDSLADWYLKKICTAEAFSKKLTYKASKSLRWWGLIFFFSLAGVSFAKALEGILGIIAIAGFLLVIGIALWKSKRFIQKCLAFD